MAAIEHLYRYNSPSKLTTVAGGADLRLVAETTSVPCFFEGRLNDPATSAMCLRAVSDLVGTRFYVPPSMLARIMREADPVATVAQETLRFEGFSACCSTYIRHDIGADAFTPVNITPGTVNVDFRDDMRAALANVRADEHLHMTISSEAITIDRGGQNVVEKKVPLPIRWLKGFAEVQAHQAGMAHAFCLGKIAAQRFLRTLPRAASNQPQWVVVSGNSARLSARPTARSVKIKGAQRLKLLERLAVVADQLDVYFNATLGSSAWVLSFGAQRLTLVLNAEPWRGFSGDGQLLSDLTDKSDANTAKLKAQLHWQSVLQRDELAKICGLNKTQMAQGLARLAASGLLGFDLSNGAYFHRVLPFDLEKIAKLNPRLTSARALVASGAVTNLSNDGADVRSDDVVHRVRYLSDETTCTCPWYAKNQASRGPCKHMLAAEIQAEAEHG